MIEWWFGPWVKTIFTWLCFLQKRHRSQSSLLPAAESSRYFHVPIWMLVDGVQGSGSTATRFNTSHFIVQTPITIMIFSRNLTGNRHDVNSSSLPIWPAPINIKQSIILSLSFFQINHKLLSLYFDALHGSVTDERIFSQNIRRPQIAGPNFPWVGVSWRLLCGYEFDFHPESRKKQGKMEKGKKKRKNEKAKERGKNKSKELLKTF